MRIDCRKIGTSVRDIFLYYGMIGLFFALTLFFSRVIKWNDFISALLGITLTSTVTGLSGYADPDSVAVCNITLVFSLVLGGSLDILNLGIATLTPQSLTGSWIGYLLGLYILLAICVLLFIVSVIIALLTTIPMGYLFLILSRTDKVDPSLHTDDLQSRGNDESLETDSCCIPGGPRIEAKE